MFLFDCVQKPPNRNAPMESLPVNIQYISLIGTLIFLYFIFKLIIKGKLREEYSIIWILCTFILIIFSIWRSGLEKVAKLLGVYYPPSLIFLAAIFAIIAFLVHLSVVNSRLQNQLKNIVHEVAYLKKIIEEQTNESKRTEDATVR